MTFHPMARLMVRLDTQDLVSSFNAPNSKQFNHDYAYLIRDMFPLPPPLPLFTDLK